MSISYAWLPHMWPIAQLPLAFERGHATVLPVSSPLRRLSSAPPVQQSRIMHRHRNTPPTIILIGPRNRTDCTPPVSTFKPDTAPSRCNSGAYCAVTPPSTTSPDPFIYAASSE